MISVLPCLSVTLSSKINKFKNMFERQSFGVRNRERERYSSLLLKWLKQLGWARPEPVSWIFIWVFYICAGALVPGLFSGALLSALARSWIRSEVAGTWTNTHIKCSHFRLIVLACCASTPTPRQSVFWCFIVLCYLKSVYCIIEKCLHSLKMNGKPYKNVRRHTVSTCYLLCWMQ